MSAKKYNYISLFSSAGIGCYGFKVENFECIATNELIPARMDIQKANNKCKYDSGYIVGDISTDQVKEKLYNEIKKWERSEGVKNIDVVVATPPCQGMSVANFKKKNEIERNSLVCHAIALIKNIRPRIFVIENVASFIKTMCVDESEKTDTIGDYIKCHLGNEYYIYHKVVNFMDYGVPSSRPRTILIGTRKDMINVSPLNIFPLPQNRIPLSQSIGDLKSLSYGEIDEHDIYHSFREYPRYMEEWIASIKEGESAYQNEDDLKPYKIKDGERVLLKSGHLGNKFRRMFWDKPAPCITTRNDQLASQSTIHPSDNRVLSIRELMRVMSIPDSFKWVCGDVSEIVDRKAFLKKNELNIRRCIGEAVPTEIMRAIAHNIKELLEFEDSINEKSIMNIQNTKNFYILSYQEEIILEDKKHSGSFYTPQSVVFESLKAFTNKKENLSILEPAVGMGAFIPQLLRLVGESKNINLTLVDINPITLQKLKENFKLIGYKRNNLKIEFINEDFLQYNFEKKFDVTIANPPYVKSDNLNTVLFKMKYADNKVKNLFGLFMYKCSNLAEENIFVIPKYFLMTPEFDSLREFLKSKKIVSIIDFGKGFFKDVGIEIISIHFNNMYDGDVYVENKRLNRCTHQPQNYIYHNKVWLIYRDRWFDEYINTLKLDVFNYYRDRQITNKYMKDSGEIKILRSKNVNDKGEIVSIKGYDKFIDNVDNFKINEYFNKDSIVITSFTYNLRAIKLPRNCIVNGSFAILDLKDKSDQSLLDLNLYASDDFRKYYAIVKNDSRYTLNIDTNSIYYIGVRNGTK